MLKTLIVVFIYFIWGFVHAQAANDIVAFGYSRPPYVMQDRQTGISVELFKSIYSKLNRQFEPIYISNSRMDHALSHEQVDIAVEVKRTNPQIFYSDEFVSYENFIIIRKGSARTIKSFSDLAGLSVCAWQQADKHLGPSFQKAIHSFRYKEFANQDAQVRVFLSGRCDSIIIDKQIFSHWTRVLRNDSSFKGRIASLDFSFFPVPGQGKNIFYVGFQNKDLRDSFNIELNSLKNSGRHSEIVNWADWSTPPSQQ